MPRSKKKAADEDLTRGDVPRTFKTTTPVFNHTRMETHRIYHADGADSFVSLPVQKAGAR